MKKFNLILLSLILTTALIAQPSNDDVCNAILLNLNEDCSATLPYTNIGATAQLGEEPGFCYGDLSVEQTVWFTFIAPPSGAVSINTDFFGGMQDNQIAVFELLGGDCTVLLNLNQIACNEDRLPSPINTQFNAALPPIPVTPGLTYYIQVDGYFDPDLGYTDEGFFCIVVSEESPPPNDDCANAEVYGGFGPSCTKIFSGTTIGATANDGLDVLSCDNSEFNATVYYTLNAGVSEVEFNLLSGENINVALFTYPNNDCSGAVEVTGNCFTNIDASDLPDPMDPDVLFTNLTPMTVYLMVIWTDEGEATDFEFCLTRAPDYECGDGECYELAESYGTCQSDCPCFSSVELYSYQFGSVTNVPEAVCPEIVGGFTDPDNLGLYIPFTIETGDSDLNGSLVTTSVGILFTSSVPPSLLPDNEATNFLMYILITESELEAGGDITITFTSDGGFCNASITININDIIRPDTSECGGCNLNVVPDYENAFCNGGTVAVTLALENAIGPNVWISQDNNTTYNPGSDIFIALDGSTSINFPANDLTLTIFDEANPNCAIRFTFTTGDFTCSYDPACYNYYGGIATVCRLEPLVLAQQATCNEDGTLNIPIDLGTATGAVTFTPDGLITGSGTVGDPYAANIDLNNCQAINVTIEDESTCDETPIVTVNAPASIAGGIVVSTNSDDWGVQIPYELGICDFGGGVTGNITVVNDGDTAGGQLTDFCEPVPPELPDQSVCDQIEGQIVLIDRGQCFFSQKVENAQNCGAIGVIVCNCQPGPAWCAAEEDALLNMAAGGYVNPIIIPAVFMLYSDCQELKAELNNGNEVELCIGAPQNIPGCEREFTLDVCNDFPADFCQNPDVPGCTNPNACNFNADATVDDGSCIIPGDACDDGDCSTENDAISAATCQCEGTPIQCPMGETFNPVTCMCEGDGPCVEDIAGSVTSPDPLCDLSGINIIITAPDGTTITVATDADGNFTVPGGPYPCGMYTAMFEDVVSLPECYTDTGSTEPLTFEIDGNINTDDGPNFIANPAIPTLSQWSLIVLALLMMVFGALKVSSVQGTFYTKY